MSSSQFGIFNHYENNGYVACPYIPNSTACANISKDMKCYLNCLRLGQLKPQQLWFTHIRINLSSNFKLHIDVFKNFTTLSIRPDLIVIVKKTKR